MYEVHVSNVKIPNQVRCRGERWETSACKAARNTGIIVNVLTADDTLVTFTREGFTSKVRKRSYKPGSYVIIHPSGERLMSNKKNRT